jgi:hypothetical protein
MESRVLNFTHDIPESCALEPPLRMILWAGDCVHNGITDIERLPNFDVYVCMGYSPTLQPNIEYLYNRDQPGVICIVDVSSDDQMQRLIKEFAGRVTTIDSDYHGNTPKMKPEYYYALLANGGRAYNVEGISGMMVYAGDYANALELFAPILPHDLRAERRYTPQMVQLAKDNNLCVDFAWTSPDLKDPYYDTIRQGQANYAAYREKLNPNHMNIYKFTEANLEEYWSDLAPEVLTFNYVRAILHNPAIEAILEPHIDRFKAYLTAKVEWVVDDRDEFREQALPFEKIQKLYTLSQYARKFSGFSPHISTYRDLRYNGGPIVYGLWVTKVVLDENNLPY